MHPLNDPPETPVIRDGPSKIHAGEEAFFDTNTTDPNGDQIEYQWNWRANKIIPYYTLIIKLFNAIPTRTVRVALS